MSTDVLTPDQTRRPDHGGAGRVAAGTQVPVPPGAPGARRPQRPVRRSRPDRPYGPARPASPVRPASPIRPAGPGRPGRTIRTVGPPRGHDEPSRASRTSAATLGPVTAGSRGTSMPARNAGRTSFVILVLGLLGGGLVCLLMVDTTLAANSIQSNRLEQANATRTQRIQQLQQDVAAAQSPAVIARAARKLGMRPQHVPAFVDLRSHSLRVGSGTTR